MKLKRGQRLKREKWIHTKSCLGGPLLKGQLSTTFRIYLCLPTACFCLEKRNGEWRVFCKDCATRVLEEKKWKWPLLPRSSVTETVVNQSASRWVTSWIVLEVTEQLLWAAIVISCCSFHRQREVFIYIILWLRRTFSRRNCEWCRRREYICETFSLVWTWIYFLRFLWQQKMSDVVRNFLKLSLFPMDIVDFSD